MSGYNRDRATAAVRSFYVFLATLPRLSAEDIVNPPEEGWLDLTDDYLAPLGKSPAVRDLLRHLPYIRSNGEGNSQVAPMTDAVDYGDSATRWTFNRGLIDGNLAPCGAGQVPPHVAVLTSGARYGSWLLLDTAAGKTGTVTDFIQQERPERSEPAQDSPDAWRAYHTRPVEEFFEEWKEKYRTLEWAAVVENVDDGVVFRQDASTDEVRQIYRDHGWPGAFNREDCQEAIRAWERRQR
ncbi:hypothetical protein PG993_005832 [Apiospora rasikravindrae]|uniref:Knr4/Smi1-like domain-containing protein n=1 Tax=Apiospora rasikravindrae TaxID=990691 RepID=A0ABR1TAI8_9PEZI